MSRPATPVSLSERAPLAAAAIVTLFLGLPVLIELALQLADAGLIGPRRLRALAYQYGAFWPGLLDNWTPNYASQPWSMFFSYSFLHTGLWHLVGNMMAFVILFRATAPHLPALPFSALYMASAFGGALGFALLGTQYQPMVGSSGALFGLVAAWRWPFWAALQHKGFAWLLFLRDTLLVVLLNAAMWVTEGGALAWEAHLGGFLAGLLVMALRGLR